LQSVDAPDKSARMIAHRAGLLIMGLALCLVLPTAARADSIVYLKGGQVWVANADNSGARPFTLHQYAWSSPSMADDGTVVVAGGLSRVNPDGSDSDGSSELYRFAPDGNQIGTFTPTYGSYSTPACPAYPPSSVRVSPDGSKIAYGIYACGAGGQQVALWTPAGSTGLSFPNQSQGQVDFWQPGWIDSTHMSISHAGPPVFGAHWGEHSTSDGDNVGAGWAEPTMGDRAADAVISRDGKKAVVFFDDAASYTDGKPRNLDMWVYSNPSMPADFSGDYGVPPAGCRFHLDATTVGQVNHLSPSLSPDGTKVLWGDDTGVEVRSLGDVAGGCVGAGAPALLVPGAAQPFYAKGNLQPAAAHPVQPGPAAGGGLVARFSLPTSARVHRTVVFDARRTTITSGRITSYAWSFGDGKKAKGRKVSHRYAKPGDYTVTLTVRDTARHQATLKHKLKVRR
jgi:hypothetical protein